ncbi:hypothetical protein EDS67_28525 [candidate division KSB1 bacterium]|nr:MAG: hypothetical protein EDS67_28525 [candidate division KSB1 bacterium]MCE7945548.1 hypothetical protein [Chlorobi bacterium CHB1]
MSVRLRSTIWPLASNHNPAKAAVNERESGINVDSRLFAAAKMPAEKSDPRRNKIKLFRLRLVSRSYFRLQGSNISRQRFFDMRGEAIFIMNKLRPARTKPLKLASNSLPCMKKICFTFR